jgi:hypothetical protein
VGAGAHPVTGFVLIVAAITVTGLFVFLTGRAKT